MHDEELLDEGPDDDIDDGDITVLLANKEFNSSGSVSSMCVITD